MTTLDKTLFLLKKYPEIMDDSFIFISAHTSLKDNYTRLIFENGMSEYHYVYFFHSELAPADVGAFFDEMAKELKQKTNALNFILASSHLKDRYKQLCDQLNIRWFEINDNRLKKWLHVNNLNQGNVRKGKGMLYDDLLMLAEDILRMDLNSSWADFSLLVGTQETAVAPQDNVMKKQRLIQVYYRQRLTYEGVIQLEYEKDRINRQWPRWLSVTVNDISTNRRETAEPFTHSVDLFDNLDWATGKMYLDIPINRDDLEMNDIEKVYFLLEKWGFSQKHSCHIRSFTAENRDYFITKLVSLTILLKTVNKVVPNKAGKVII
ncbi:hypothetical protein HXA31_07110 [Salipaludibacillus agaradhaerens]|uniref:Uncharacterized protein n=1 Tax=Salipaludibacillus agaradhaerens TaxID=76935 RepID=A0A9Q4B0Z0_SALAG|nr:hypothetical protein [Salipaludibacillus agaradhaerens]MCR6096309.1 hypothetical protein [Salipaludibacillus agaradhaerens]MCR6114132.1 hypothetical protein [Salipaludibacillus agaradhaerens]